MGGFSCARPIKLQINKKKWTINWSIILGLLIPILIIGLRASSVGTDTATHIREFEFGVSGQDRSANTIEPLFFILTWVSNFLVGGPLVLFLFYAAVLVVFTYLAIKRWVPKEDVWVVFALFMFILIPLGMNGMRQLSAIAIAFYGFRYIYERKLWKWIGIIALAALFHLSVGIVLPLYLLFCKKLFETSKYKDLTRLFFPAICYICLVVGLWFSLDILLYLNLVPPRYIPYIGGASTHRMVYVSLAWMWLVGIIFMAKRMGSGKKHLFIYSLSLVALPLNMLNMVMYYGGRTFYYIIPAILVGLYYSSHKIIGKNKRLASGVCVAAAIAFFLLYFVWMGASQIVPYRSIFL